jgi:hypothetical protein
MVPSTLCSFMEARPPAACGSAVTPRCTTVSTPVERSTRTSAGLPRSTWRNSTLASNSSKAGASSTATTLSTDGSSASAATTLRPVDRAAPVTRMRWPGPAISPPPC